MDEFSLQDKVILVTGASSGIGKSTAIICSSKGAKVAIVGRDPQRTKECFDSLQGDGHVYFIADITLPDSVKNIVTETKEKLGSISGFVHAAGICSLLPISNINERFYQNLYKINVFTAFEFSKYLNKKNNCLDNASFIFISSVTGFLGNSACSVYGSTKGAITAMVKSLAVELISRKIRVNAISPGIIDTPLYQDMENYMGSEYQRILENKYPFGVGKPEDVALACVYLLSDASKWVTGTNLIVDGGMSMQ